MSRSVTQDNAESLARERARQARAQEGHVTAWDWLGSAPDWTEGKSTDEWMDEQRGRS